MNRVWGKGVSATDMHQGAGWVRGEPSNPAAWKADTLGLPDPPSQLSAEEEERKRERLVPEFTRVVGAFALWQAPPWVSNTPSLTGGMRARDVDPNLGFQSQKLTTAAMLLLGGCRDREGTSDTITHSQEGRPGVLQGLQHGTIR